jgi:putative salt-induced outer membrane protein
MTARAWCAAACLSLVAAIPAGAQAPPAPPALLHTQIDLGFVNTAGNSSVRTLSLAEQFVVQPAPWKLTQTFTIVNGYTSGVETANNLKAGLRADYAVGARLHLYALFDFYRNRFAGVARQFEEAGGLAYGLLTGPTHVLDVEAGAGRTQLTGPSGPVRQYWTSRLATRYRVNFTKLAYAEQKLELISDLQDLPNELLNSETALVAPLSQNVALKLGYVVRFANRPQPTFKKADTILSAGLQLQF